MTTIDTKHLRELAEAATPGPWKASPYTRGNPCDGPTLHSIRSTEDSGDERCKYQIAETEYDEMGWRDAAYIAAIDPPTLIALLDELEKYRSWADRILGNPPDLNEQHERLKAQIAATGVLEQRVIQPGEARSL